MHETTLLSTNAQTGSLAGRQDAAQGTLYMGMQSQEQTLAQRSAPMTMQPEDPTLQSSTSASLSDSLPDHSISDMLHSQHLHPHIQGTAAQQQQQRQAAAQTSVAQQDASAQAHRQQLGEAAVQASGRAHCAPAQPLQQVLASLQSATSAMNMA